MDYFAEYEEFAKLPAHVAVTYKFFTLFSVSKEGVLSWGSSTHPLGADEGAALKTFLKSQRTFLRDTPGAKASECARRMWFWGHKMLEENWFDLETRAEILRWMEICELVVP